MSAPMPQWQTVAQAAERLGLSVNGLRHYLKGGRIAGAQKLGRDWLLPSDCALPERERPGRKPRVPPTSA